MSLCDANTESVSTSHNDELMSVIMPWPGQVQFAIIDFDDSHGVQNLVVKLHFFTLIVDYTTYNRYYPGAYL